MKRETFEIVWPFIEKMTKAYDLAGKSHDVLHAIGIRFEPWDLAPSPDECVAQILLSELKLPQEEYLSNMAMQIWNEIGEIREKEAYYNAICNLMKEWYEE